MKAWLPIIIVFIVVAFIVLAIMGVRAPSNATTQEMPIATVTYACSKNKTITAAYYHGDATSTPDANQPPIPSGYVKLTLSDSRTMTLPQTISADGARYATKDESIIFWNKGRGITFTENNQQTFSGCIELAVDPGGLPQSYVNVKNGFSIRYPDGYTADETYKYQELGPGKDIAGVKFTIPTSVATGTNLSSDSYASVEELPQAKDCSATLFFDKGTHASTETDDDITYSVASSTGAGAGNRYEEWVYALPGTNPCIAVRYFIHYGVFENYPEGAVKEFDKEALLNQFDSIRHTLTVVQ